MLKQSERQDARTVAGLVRLGVSVVKGQQYKIMSVTYRHDAVYIRTDDEYLRVGTINALTPPDGPTEYYSMPWNTGALCVKSGIDIAHMLDYCYTTGE